MIAVTRRSRIVSKSWDARKQSSTGSPGDRFRVIGNQQLSSNRPMGIELFVTSDIDLSIRSINGSSIKFYVVTTSINQCIKGILIKFYVVTISINQGIMAA
jgi:hypothetical protein